MAGDDGKGGPDEARPAVQIPACPDPPRGFGEQSDDVNGAVVQVRPKLDKIALWTATVRRSEGNIKIGKTLKERLSMHPRSTIPYQAHADTQSKHVSTARPRYEM
ncbi:hypothetical protein MRX96_026991 [Rhipicephalus microplus]